MNDFSAYKHQCTHWQTADMHQHAHWHTAVIEVPSLSILGDGYERGEGGKKRKSVQPPLGLNTELSEFSASPTFFQDQLVAS